MSILIQSELQQKLFEAEAIIKFDIYCCENLTQLDFVKPFIEKEIHSLQKIDNIQDFQLTDIKNGYYIYTRTRTIKVGFDYFWNGYLSVPERPLVFHLLSLIPNSAYETNLSECDIIYHSHFCGNNFSNHKSNKKYIFFSGEKHYFQSEKYHLSLSYLPDSKNTVCYPYFFTVMHTYSPRYNNVYIPETNQNIPEEFCAFIISNPGCKIRNSFFNFVCNNYKKVNSYGKCFNNVGYLLDFPYNDKRQLELLSKHKFVICFENTKTDNYYITEKILIAKAAGCIPIYWGSDKCKELFNINSFLYLEEDTTKGFEKLLSKIKLLDSNSDLYLKIRNTPLIENSIFQKYSKSVLQNKMNKILFSMHIYVKEAPKFYYINLKRSQQRRNLMIQLFEEYGITKYERVEAIDGKNINHTEKRLNIYEEACTLSHLKAIQQFYESNLESAIICEDDISLEWIDLWKKPLNQIIQEAPKDCQILQLAYTLYPFNFNKIKTDYNPFQLVTFNGAMAYYITRDGAKNILDKHTYQNPRLNLYTKVRPVSDVLIFDLAKTYTYKYCLFTYPENNDSTIHYDNLNFHLNLHMSSKMCARRLYDIL